MLNSLPKARHSLLKRADKCSSGSTKIRFLKEKADIKEPNYLPRKGRQQISEMIDGFTYKKSGTQIKHLKTNL